MPLVRSFQIMRPGTFKSSSGCEFSFTARDLMEVAESYSTKKRVAPLTINHPNDDKPELGEVKALYFDRDALYAVGSFSSYLEDSIKKGEHQNRSAALYLPETPGNPTPGKYYLKHVGFLDNNIAPAIKGMEPVQFSSAGGIASFSSYCDPVNFNDVNYCNTDIRIPITRKDGRDGYGFIWRGHILELHE